MSSDHSTAKAGWTKTAPKYASTVGKSSAMGASHLVTLASNLKPITPSSRVLDNGAGTGACTLAVSAHCPSTPILAVDISEAMLANIDGQHLPNVRTRPIDAMELTQSLLPNDKFTHVFNTFMLQILQTPTEAVREMHSALEPGGVIAIGVWWERNDVFDIWVKACQAVDPSYVFPPPMDDPNAWRTPEELSAKLAEVGFEDVKTETLMMDFAFDSPEAFARFWFEAQNPGATKSIQSWKGDLKPVREQVLRIVREQYGGGSEIALGAVLGVGRKQSPPHFLEAAADFFPQSKKWTKEFGTPMGTYISVASAVFASLWLTDCYLGRSQSDLIRPAPRECEEGRLAEYRNRSHRLIRDKLQLRQI